LKNKFLDIKSFEYISRESVNRWVDNGAIGKARRELVKSVYRNASDDFKKIHQVRFGKDDIFDSMNLVIVRAKKK
jgi:hypothetical protein